MTIAEVVVDSLPIAVYAIDDDRFVYVNSKFAETLGYTKQELLGFKSAVDIIAGDQKKIISELLQTGSLNDGLSSVHHDSSVSPPNAGWGSTFHDAAIAERTECT